MILGTGIDLLKISRVKKVLNKYGDLFVKKVSSDDEIKNNKEIIFKANKLAVTDLYSLSPIDRVALKVY